MDVIQPLLQAVGSNMLRYGGGCYADYYGWQTNTNIQALQPNFRGTTGSWPAACRPA